MASTREADYYRVLQVDPDAEPEVIAAAYRRLAAKYHPDVNRSPESEARMRELNAAHEILSDAARRQVYDQSRAPSWMPGLGGTIPNAPRRAGSPIQQIARSVAIMIAWSIGFTILGKVFGGQSGMAIALILILAIALWKGDAILRYLGRSR